MAHDLENEVIHQTWHSAYFFLISFKFLSNAHFKKNEHLFLNDLTAIPHHIHLFYALPFPLICCHQQFSCLHSLHHLTRCIVSSYSQYLLAIVMHSIFPFNVINYVTANGFAHPLSLILMNYLPTLRNDHCFIGLSVSLARLWAPKGIRTLNWSLHLQCPTCYRH